MGRERIVSLSSFEETVEAGRILGSLLLPNSILALRGDMGTGKTTLVQGLARGLRINASIQSPTFIYLNSYEGLIPLFHFDLYRMKAPSDFLGLGFDEYFDRGGVCAIEWPEKIISLLPKRTLFFFLSHHPQGRLLSFSGDYPEKLLDSLTVCH